MQVLILQEGVLNDDTLYLADENKVFKGGYTAIIEYFTFATTWSNNKHFKHFRSMQTLRKYLKKHYATSEVLQEV